MSRAKADADLYGEGLLGESLAPKKSGELANKFMIPPFTVLSAREGWWQDRKRAWLSLGIQSELGRGDDNATGSAGLTFGDKVSDAGLNHYCEKEKHNAAPGGSNMPAMNYKKGQRGTGAGKAIAGTESKAHKPAAAPASAPAHKPGAYVEPPPEAPKPAQAALKAAAPAVARPAAPAHRPPAFDPSIPAAAPAAPPAGSLARVTHTPAPPRQEASKWMAPVDLPNLDGVKRLSIDCETYDPQLLELGPGVRRGAYVVGVALGTDDGRRWYLPTRHEGGGNLDEGLVQRWAKDELNTFKGELVGANLLYDMDFLAEPQWGVDFKQVKAFHDIQIAEPLLDEWRMEYSLEAIAQDYLKEGKNEDLLKQAAAMYGNGNPKSLIWKMPANYVGPYAEGDADLPLRILPMQLKKLEDENLNGIYTIERKLIPLLLAMRRRGVRVNTAKVDEVRSRLVKERDVALAKVRAIAGPKAELMAPETFAQAFVDRGLQVPLTPKTKKPSIKGPWLAANANDELAAAILEGRKVETIINTFIDGHINTHAINGRIHCQFNQLKGEDGGTIARFSSSNPNLQNLPARDEELGPLVRGLFIPEDGETWERHDESQIEYRLLVHFAIGPKADEARKAYNDDPTTDFHKMCAEFCGIDPEDKIARKKVKGVNFGKTYGAGAAKLAIIIGCSVQEAEEFIALYNEKLPFQPATLSAAMRWAEKQGFVSTVLGRKQRFLLWEPMGYGHDKPPLREAAAREAYGPRIKRYKTYAALNRKLQGSGADLMKKAMVDIQEAGILSVLGAPLLTVHDELDYSVPNTKAGREAAAEAKRLMEQAVPLKVPVYVEASSGKDWGEAS